jgi:hypothetical protein
LSQEEAARVYGPGKPLPVYAQRGGKVSKTQITQFGRAMRHLGIQMIAAYSPEARWRSERAFLTRQDRLAGN